MFSLFFYINALVYWLSNLVAPLLNEYSSIHIIYENGQMLNSIQIIMMLLVFLYKGKALKKPVILLISCHFLYTIIVDRMFGPVSYSYYAAESALFLSAAVWLYMRPSIMSCASINRKNILLAFYKGRNGSFTMNFFELFGMPVKSMCVIAGEKCLRLRAGVDSFSVSDGGAAMVNSSDYLIIDTGKEYTEKFVSDMGKFNNAPARTSGFLRFRCRCIEAVRDLLYDIGEEWRPRNRFDYIPSIFCKRCLNIRVR